MKIYFCDGCNESVPLADIKAGQVTTIKSKLFCSNCIPPGTVSAPAAPPAAASGGRGAWLAVLVVLVVAWTVWRDRAQLFGPGPLLDNGAETAAPSPATRGELENLEAEVRQVQADGGRRERSLTSLRSDVEALRAADNEHARASERLAEEIDRLMSVQGDAGQLVESQQLLANRTDSLEIRVDGLVDSVAAHQLALDLGSAQGGAVTRAGGATGTDGPAPEAAMDPARRAALEEIRRMLLDPEPDMRFEGVDRAEEGRYVEVAPDLVRLLQDEDMFVRLHVMNVLGGFGYEEAVPALFEVLADDNAAIRKAAAETLVGLTGYDPGYDPKGSQAERAKSVKAWQDWYASR